MLLEKCMVMRFWNPDPGLLKPIVVNSSINYRICQLTLGVEGHPLYYCLCYYRKITKVGAKEYHWWIEGWLI